MGLNLLNWKSETESKYNQIIHFNAYLLKNQITAQFWIQYTYYSNIVKQYYQSEPVFNWQNHTIVVSTMLKQQW